jgi:hypothetical protein
MLNGLKQTIAIGPSENAPPHAGVESFPSPRGIFRISFRYIVANARMNG